jgi:hypothetical protein
VHFSAAATVAAKVMRTRGEPSRAWRGHKAGGKGEPALKVRELRGRSPSSLQTRRGFGQQRLGFRDEQLTSRQQAGQHICLPCYVFHLQLTDPPFKFSVYPVAE